MVKIVGRPAAPRHDLIATESVGGRRGHRGIGIHAVRHLAQTDRLPHLSIGQSVPSKTVGKIIREWCLGSDHYWEETNQQAQPDSHRSILQTTITRLQLAFPTRSGIYLVLVVYSTLRPNV